MGTPALTYHIIYVLFSGRHDNCQHYCSGCGANITCFLEQQLLKMLKLAQNNERDGDMETMQFLPISW
jgi:hypothetical protein